MKRSLPSPKKKTRRRWLRVVLGVVVVGVFLLVVLPAVLPLPASWTPLPAASPELLDRRGVVVARRVGEDDHWCFPRELGDFSPWLVKATVAVEDSRFWTHHGVDPLAVARAARDNLTTGRRVSGASTLTMQLCRLLNEKPRTWPNKLTEAFQALQMEHGWSKETILTAYLNRAPYGGNLRGAEAAAWRYFGIPAKDLSVAQAALIAGLPQSPERLRPDRKPEAAKVRRDTVLRALFREGFLGEKALAEALAEPVRLHPPVPEEGFSQWAESALARRSAGGRTTLDADRQREVFQLARTHADSLAPGTQVAVVVLELPGGQIRAMIGGTARRGSPASEFNAALARRSPGSTLKPFVYGAAFATGRRGPESVLLDQAMDEAGWNPRNFDRETRGEVTAAEALRLSLNLPALRLARETGLARCAGVMRACGVSLAPEAERRAGLALVVGGAETDLLSLTASYATLGRGGRPGGALWWADEVYVGKPAVLDANVCRALDDILSSAKTAPSGWEALPPARRPWFMWKTGTSSARRDAWALGHNTRFAIGVWVGRPDGAGDATLTGHEVAEPLLAKLFTLAALRQDNPPPPATPSAVKTPPMKPASGRVRIVSPGDGTSLLAPDGVAEVFPRADREAGLVWLLDDRPLGEGEMRPLKLAPGRHELRCVDSDGGADAVRIEVR